MISDSESCAIFGDSDPHYPLSDTEPDASHVAEIGPGSGAGTIALLGYFPTAVITVLEPNPASRSSVLWRTRDMPGVQSRLNVLPVSLEDAPKAGEVDYIFMRHVICQVKLKDRRTFWSGLVRLMGEDTVAYCDGHFGPEEVREVPRRLAASGRVGVYSVNRWYSMRRVDDSHVQVTNEYEYLDAMGDVVHTERNRVVQEIVGASESMDLLSRAGLSAEIRPEGWLAIRRGG